MLQEPIKATIVGEKPISNDMDQFERENAIIMKVAEFVHNFNENSDYHLYMPYVIFSKRLTSAGGQAEWNKRTDEMTVKFSVPIMMNPNNDFAEYVRTVVAHECAHLFDYVIRKGSNHDNHFRALMIKYCGSDYKDTGSTHNFKTRKKRYKVTCQCGAEFVFTPAKVGKMRRGLNLTHTKCGNRISYQNVGESFIVES